MDLWRFAGGACKGKFTLRPARMVISDRVTPCMKSNHCLHDNLQLLHASFPVMLLIQAWRVVQVVQMQWYHVTNNMWEFYYPVHCNFCVATHVCLYNPSSFAWLRLNTQSSCQGKFAPMRKQACQTRHRLGASVEGVTRTARCTAWKYWGRGSEQNLVEVKRHDSSDAPSLSLDD